VPEFASVQSIGWNGRYWLIGGFGFLAKYDGYNFTDLTNQLAQKVDRVSLTVNAIAWDGSSWMIAGGTPIAQIEWDVAWMATYGPGGFDDLSAALPTYISHPRSDSSILTICRSDDAWILGGYSDGNGVLLSITNGAITDLSSLVSPTMSYVNWVSTDS
jgi:hypothetical protein